jgi:hypothetical protein
MAHDVFISYSSQDKPVADAICNGLESCGIRCWIAPRDILPGSSYGEALMKAIEGCRILVVVFSSRSNGSRFVEREVEAAVSGGATVIPVRIEDVVPSGSMRFFLGLPHWLDALTPPLERHIDALAASICSLLERIPPAAVARARYTADPVIEVPPDQWHTGSGWMARLQRLFEQR